MSQPRRTIERFIHHGILPITDAEAAATHLKVYPDGRTWLKFFDNAALIIGAVALVLALVFFIAYNWLNMGKLGKFALVEGALVITIALYVALSFRRRFELIRQLLLLIASIITGSLLALFGQVYQTGADTWQLFFGWAVLIIPWVLIARLPALWLLWLGLANTCLILYLALNGFSIAPAEYQDILQIGVLALGNFSAFVLWLSCFKNIQGKLSLHWSTYIVGLLSSFFISFLAIMAIFEHSPILARVIAFGLWLGWCAFMYWRFAKRQLDVLMLTYGCFSIIAIVMFWTGKLLPNNYGAGSFLSLALLLLGMSSMAVIWLRGLAHSASLNQNNQNQNSQNSDNNYEPPTVAKGGDYE